MRSVLAVVGLVLLANAGCWEAPSSPPAHGSGTDRGDATRGGSGGGGGADPSHGSSGNGRGGDHHATKK